MSHIDLSIIHARHRDFDEAPDHGVSALRYERKTEASLLSHTAGLDQLLRDRYPGERLMEDFQQLYHDARISLRQKAQSDP